MPDLESRLSTIESVIAGFAMKALNGQVSACKSLLYENAAVNVAVLGKFKAGKSSFLNSLAGRNILPTGVVPVTAVVTALFWAKEETVLVRKLDGGTIPIPLSGIADYVTEELNPKNRLGVASVEIGLPALAEYKGLRFVDTPGLDSAYRHNTETSLDWLPNAGLAILTVSADAPLSEQDLDLLEKTSKHCPGIIILLTKADRFNAGELGQVLAYMSARLKERFSREFPLFPFSIMENFALLRKEFYERAIKPLASDTAAEKATIVEHKLGFLEQQCLEYLLAARAAATRAIEEREKLKVLALKQRARLEKLKEDFKTIFAVTSEKTRLEIERLVLAYAPAAVKELKTALSEKLSDRSFNLLEMTRTYDIELQKFFAEKTAAVFMAEKNRLDDLAAAAAAAFASMANDFCARLVQEAENALGVRLPRSSFEPSPAKLPSPDVKVSQAFDSHLELLWFLIPARLFRKALLRHFLGLVPFETEKNLTRLAMGLAMSINNKTEKAMKFAIEYVVNIHDTIERLLSTNPDNLGKIEAAISSLKTQDT